MSALNRVIKILARAALGIFSGILWSIVYIYIIPGIVSGSGFQMEGVSQYYLWIIIFFTATGVSVSLIENTLYKFTLNTFAKTFGFWILAKILNNGILSTTVSYENMNMTITVDFTIILYLIGLWTMATVLVDFYSMISKSGESEA